MPHPDRTLPFLVLTLSCAAGCASTGAPPPPTPVVVGPGLVSTERPELMGSVSPDGSELYFTRVLDNVDRAAIFVARRSARGWEAPVQVFPPTRSSDRDPFLSPDGSQLFFSSDRTAPGKSDRSYDIWVAVRQPDRSWGTPVRLPVPVNSTTSEVRPVAVADQTLYLGSGRPPNPDAGLDLYRTRWLGDRYDEPEMIPLPKTPWVYVTPDERVMLVFVADPAGSRGRRLAISRGRGGVWGEPQFVGSFGAVTGHSPVVSPDGRHLYFTADGVAGRDDIYQLDLRALRLPRSVRSSLRWRP